LNSDDSKAAAGDIPSKESQSNEKSSEVDKSESKNMDGTAIADNARTDSNAKIDDTTNPVSESKQKTISGSGAAQDILGASMSLDKQPPAAIGGEIKALA